jgi:hypothetical protein
MLAGRARRTRSSSLGARDARAYALRVDAPTPSVPSYRFAVHGERLAIAKLALDSGVPSWAGGEFLSVLRTPRELSIVCAQTRVPRELEQVRDKVALGIEGGVPLTSVGVLAALCGALAQRGVPVFVLSTHDTDWLLVSAERLGDARGALEAAGHRVHGALPTL